MENEQRTDDLQKLINSLASFVTDSKSALDLLQSKEKSIDKAFKKEFQDVTPTQMEYLLKLYKKRPKSNIRAITSQCILWECAHALVTNKRSIILNGDAIDFLKMIDGIDKYIGIPPIIDETMYSVLCKHRRLRIELEIKIRACQMEFTEAEHTVAMYHRVLNYCKEENLTLIQDLTNIRNKKIKNSLNTQLQLVLKEGYVEMKRHGMVNDFADALLISRKEIEDINKIIIEAGKAKLKAMRNAMQFKREILMKEWEHRRMKMQIVDLEMALVDVRSVRVTKEIQSFLKSRARGEAADKSLLFETEVANMKMMYSLKIREKKQQCAELEADMRSLHDDNDRLDKQIQEINVDICEAQLYYDPNIHEREKRLIDIKMTSYRKRSKLVQQIQGNHTTILMLQAELELLRLRTVPILDYKIEI